MGSTQRPSGRLASRIRNQFAGGNQDFMRESRARLITAGVLLAALYAIVAQLTAGHLLPIRPIYEGYNPPNPYAWVTPPAARKNDNVPPSAGSGTIALTKAGSSAGTIATDDGQAVVTFFKGTFKAKPGEKSIRVDIKPLDPDKVGKAPSDRYYDGNAYDITARYLPSDTPATVTATSCPLEQNPKVCPTLVLRYAYQARELFFLEKSTWSKVAGASAVDASLQVFADIPKLGTFVAVDTTSRVQKPKGPKLTDILVVSIAGLAVIGVVVSRLLSSRKKKKRKPAPRSKDPSQKKRR